MAITKAKKKEIVQKIKDVLGKAESVVFVSFNKLQVAEETELRRALRAADSGYMVVKKTLLDIALGDHKADGTRPELAGEVAIAYGSDPVMPAKKIAEFGKKFQEKLAIIGGIFEGVYQDAREMGALAAIPGRETLLGMFANVINSPISGLVIALDGIAKKKAS